MFRPARPRVRRALVALATLVAVAPSSLALHSAAAAAPSPTPAVTEETPLPPEATAPTVELTDLGSLDGMYNDGVISAINNTGEAVGWAYKTDSEGYPAIFTSAGRRSIAAAFSDWVHVRPLALNDEGVVVGDMSNGGASSMFRWAGGGMTNLGSGTATGINGDGMILTDRGTVLRPEQPELDLTPGRDVYNELSAINDKGNVVGLIDANPDPDVKEFRAFRSRPGEPIDLTRDVLPFGDGNRAIALDVNDAGVAVGYGKDNSGGYVPTFWSAEGSVATPQTPHGGKVLAVNDAGLAVGTMYTATGDERAALYDDGPFGSGRFLQALLPADSPWILDDAVDINDRGQIVGHMHRADDGSPGNPVTHGYILDLASETGPRLVDFVAEHEDYPSGDWVQLPQSGTYDGNTVRLRSAVKNATAFASAVTVEFRKPDGGLVEDGRFEEILMPGETLEHTVTVDTAGDAWTSEGEPKSTPHRYTVEVRSGGAVEDGGEVGVLVKPRPVVLVHGYKSSAQASWGKYATLLAGGHPHLKGYAVGDGQFDGKMNTGSLDAPFARTNTIEENAVEEGVYIQDLRSTLDAWHVDIVAHSMGGLISRYYVQELMPEPPEDGRPVVNRLIQLGTPNKGSTCAELLLLLGELSPTGPPLMPATLQLSRTYAATTFNPKVTNLRGVRLSNMFANVYPILCGLNEMGDGVVPQDSAKWNLNDLGYSFSNHIEMTEDYEDFQDYVLPRLKQPPVPASGARHHDAGAESAGAESVGAAESDASASAPLPPLGGFLTSKVTVEPGTSQYVSLPVTQAESFGVTVMGPPTMRLSLRDPYGRSGGVIEPGSQQARSPFQGLKVDSPAVGDWRLRLDNTGAEPVTVPVVGWLVGGSLELTAAATAQETGRVTVEATFTEAGSPTEAAVTAIVTDAANQRHELDLFDDGQHGDGAGGDGTYVGTTEVLPDGDTAVVVRADTAAGRRLAAAAVRVASVDRSPKTLTLTSQPGGSAVATPAGPGYEFGSKVVLKATPKPGEMHQGWVVDGVEKPAGDLTLTMDRDHEVVARFGHYTITELPALPGGRAENTVANALNDKGQVALRVTEGSDNTLGHRRAAVYANGVLTRLPGLPCDRHVGTSRICEDVATGIDNAGNVVGSSYTDVGGGTAQHAVVWRQGKPVDLYPDSAATSAAVSIGENGQIVGWVWGPESSRYRSGIWTNGSFRRFSDYHLDAVYRGPTGRINAKGQVALNWVNYDYWGTPWWTEAARYSAGSVGRLPQLEGCPPPHDEPSSEAHGINASGVIVGEARCPHYGVMQAMLWKEGKARSLGDGRAYDINDGGVIIGDHWDGTHMRPVLWIGDERFDLADYLPAACPVRIEDTKTPCFGVTRLIDVNNDGQMVASGFFRDRADLPGTWSEHPRSFLLSPSKVDADLAVTQDAPLVEVAPGVTMTRKVTVTNNGPDEATGVVVDLEVPQQLAVTDCTGSAGDCAALKTGRRIVVEKLAPGESATLTVKARVLETAPLGSKLVTTATAFSRAVRDKATADNVATRSVTVRPMVEGGIMWPDAVGVGAESHPVTRMFTNRTEEPMTIGEITATDGFTATDSCPTVLGSGESCEVTVVFKPTDVRDYTGVVSIPATPGGVYTMPVHGRGKVNNVKPVITPPTTPQTGVVGKEFTLRVAFTDADVNDTHTAQIVWPEANRRPVPVDAVEESGGSGVVIARRTFTAPVTDEPALVIVSDSAGNSEIAHVPFTITQMPANTAPVVTVGGDEELLSGERLTRLGSFSDTGSTSWTATVDYGDGGGARELSLDGHDFELDHAYTEPGTYPVKVRVVDDEGLSGTATFTVTVTKRNTVPVVTLSPAQGAVEGGGWTLEGSFIDPDDDDWSASVDYGDGVVEALAVDGMAFELDHSWADDGVHTVTVTVSDGAGGEASAAVDVSVTNTAPTAKLVAPSPGTTVAVGTPVSLHASLADPGVEDTHTATWHIGDADLEGTVTEGGGVGTIAVERAFTKAGRYRIALTVTDDDGAKAVVDEVDGEPLVVTVVDPDSRVDGRGAFHAPAGSCTLAPGCGSSGRMSFSMTADYEPGSLALTGEVRVTTSGFRLSGNELTSLITADGKGSLDGIGLVNGEVPVRFTVDFVGNRGPGHPGQLRLRVWRAGDAQLVYDNAPDGLGDSTGQVSGQLDVR